MPENQIDAAVDRGVLRITLKRPPLNIMGLSMLAEIQAALNGLGRNPGLRAILFAAEGKVFSAGTDVRDHLPPHLEKMLSAFHAIFRTLDALGVPAIARVDGAALGGGCELAVFCDWVFATPKSSFGFPEIKLGVFPPAAAAFLSSLIGSRQAADLILTGRTVMPEEAANIGLITKVSATLTIEDDIEKILERLREMSPDALRAARQALRKAQGRPFAEALTTAEKVYLAELPKSPDMEEGLKAFLEKRPPKWKA